MAEYRFERLSEAHFPALAVLFREVFGFRAPPTYFQQKYDTTYLGVSHVCFVACLNEKAVAFHGCLPLGFSFLGKKYLAAQTCDYLTLEAHRGKGLNKTLGEKSYALMKSEGIGFLCTLNSDVTFAVHSTLGWLDPEVMHRYHFATGAPPLAKVARRIRQFDPAYQAWVHRVFKRYRLPEAWFPNPLAEAGWLCADYTPAYFGYKKFTPNFIVALDGVPLWIKVDGVLQIGAMGAFSPKKFPAILTKLRALGRLAGVGELLFQTAPGTPLDAALSQLTPPLPSWRVGYFDLGAGLPVEKLKLNFAELDTF